MALQRTFGPMESARKSFELVDSLLPSRVLVHTEHYGIALSFDSTPLQSTLSPHMRMSLGRIEIFCTFVNDGKGWLA